MSLVTRIKTFVNSIPLRLNPSIRFCGSLFVNNPINFEIDKSSNLRCELYCDKATILIDSKVNIPSGVNISSVDGAKIHLMEGVTFGKLSTLSVANDAALIIGAGTSFYSSTLLSGSISIGKGCLFGPNVTVMSGEHVIDDQRPIRLQDAEFIKEHGKPPSSPVEIGDDCWIGVNAVILPGVKLGRGCVVGAGAVVTKSFSEYCIIGGVPARMLKKRKGD